MLLVKAVYAEETAQVVVAKERTTIVKIVDFITENAVKYSFQAIGGLVILLAAWALSRFVARIVHRALVERKVDISIVKFIAQAVRIAIMVLGILMTLSSFGVQIAPLIAGLSVAGVGIGLAIQGPLSNYAAGATLIFTKPFRVGEIIEVNGYQGEVADITLPRTELNGLDGSRIIIPNKHIIGEVIKNFSEHRRLEINVGISYNSDVNKALGIIENIIKNEEHIPNHEAYKVGIKEFADSAINIQAFVWVPQLKFTETKFSMHKAILADFNKHGIVIPFPQRDVHLYQQ